MMASPTPMMTLKIMRTLWTKKPKTSQKRWQRTTLNDVYAVWKDMPSYPPLYMSTVGEYLPPEPKAKANIKVDDGLGDGKTKGGLGSIREFNERGRSFLKVHQTRGVRG
jgi:hypothetical protein